jgi:hypothetical protein
MEKSKSNSKKKQERKIIDRLSSRACIGSVSLPHLIKKVGALSSDPLKSTQSPIHPHPPIHLSIHPHLSSFCLFGVFSTRRSGGTD